MNAPGRAHARLPPSAAHRWMECPGSVRLSEGIPSRTSVYAEEGTKAHALAAHCLETGVDPDVLLAVDQDMAEAVQVYVDFVRSLSGELEVEQRLDMRHIDPGIFGTGDAVVYQPGEQHLHVVDFKYGKGVAVEVTDNPQLMLYGAGALHRHHNRPIKRVTLDIVQPRAPHKGGPIRSWTTDPIDLMEFEDELTKLAAATAAPDAPLHAGDWCRFCPAAPICPALRERARQAAMADFAEVAEPASLSSQQLAAVLHEAELIGNWLKAVQEYAHSEATAGRILPGFKLVWKRATRKWRNAEAALNTLIVDMDLTEAEVMTRPALLSPAQLEKAIGKRRFTKLSDLIVKESTGTNLVPESDPRPAAKADGVSDFEEVE